MPSIAQAVKLAIERGQFDHEWNRVENIGQQASTIHMANEFFTGAASYSARADFYTMWAPVYRKHRTAKAS